MRKDIEEFYRGMRQASSIHPKLSKLEGNMNPGWIVARVLIELAAIVLVVNVSLWAISSPDTINNALGSLALIGVAGHVVNRAVKLYKKFKDLPLMLVLAMFTFMASGCGQNIQPGHAGILVHKYGSKKGTDIEPLPVGMKWYNPWTEMVYDYPTFVQTAKWTASKEDGSDANEEITFNTAEGMVITADVSLSYALVPDKVPEFFEKFRTDDLQGFTHGFMRNVARDAFNEEGAKYTVEQAYGEKKEELLTNVRARINSFMEPYGVAIEQFGFIGAPRLPEDVTTALNAKIQATQNAVKVRNQVAEATAEADKKIELARGEAESNRLLANSITPQLLEWKRLQITEQAVQKWDGARPKVEGSDAGLLLQIQ